MAGEKGKGTVTFAFSAGKALRLHVEVLDATLTDPTDAWPPRAGRGMRRASDRPPARQACAKIQNINSSYPEKWEGSLRLTKVTIENFRCYKEETSISFADMTAIVGRNDVGKSAILEALAVFFGEAEIERADASVGGDPLNVKITCEFDDLPSTLILDADFETSLSDEHLLNESGRLEVRKVYNASLAKPKLTSVDAVALHPTAKSYSDLLQLKNAELVARAKELGISLDDVNKQANAPIRAAIWAHAADLESKSHAVPLEKEGAKQIWAALQSYLPGFALFKSDRASSDQDSEAQDPLKAAIKDALALIEPKLKEVQEYVESEVQKIANATVAKIKEMDPSIADTLSPVIATKKWDSLFQTSITGDEGIPLNKRGSGVRRLVLLNFFRAKAELVSPSSSTGSVIYAIEEPETSQHPRNQRLLMSALRDISAQYGRQVIITTHTPMLARTLPENALRFVDVKPDKSRSVEAAGTDFNKKVAASLGVLADHNVRIFVGVEGKHDISFLKHASRIFNADSAAIPSLESHEIAGELIFVPLGGSNLALWASRLAPLERPEFHLCDRDVAPPEGPKYAQHIADLNSRDGCKGVHTAKRELENYIHPDAVAEAYADNGITLTLPASFADFEDVPLTVAQAVQAASAVPWPAHDQKKCDQKTSNAKSIINNAAVRKMTVARFALSDPHGEILSWLNDIKTMMG